MHFVFSVFFFQVNCSASEYPELFAAIPYSYGTIGFLTAVDLDIIQFKPYIKLNYHPTNSLDGLTDKLTEVSGNGNIDSVEVIMYSLESSVVMTGTFVDKVPNHGRINRIGLWFKPWFFKYVETFLNKDDTKPSTEYIPTKVG